MRRRISAIFALFFIYNLLFTMVNAQDGYFIKELTEGDIYAFAYNGNTTVAVGKEGLILKSSVNYSWSIIPLDYNYYDITNVVWTGTQFVAMSKYNYDDNVLLLSKDGNVWEKKSIDAGMDVIGKTEQNKLFFVKKGDKYFYTKEFDEFTEIDIFNGRDSYVNEKNENVDLAALEVKGVLYSDNRYIIVSSQKLSTANVSELNRDQYYGYTCISVSDNLEDWETYFVDTTNYHQIFPCSLDGRFALYYIKENHLSVNYTNDFCDWDSAVLIDDKMINDIFIWTNNNQVKLYYSDKISNETKYMISKDCLNFQETQNDDLKFSPSMYKDGWYSLHTLGKEVFIIFNEKKCWYSNDITKWLNFDPNPQYYPKDNNRNYNEVLYDGVTYTYTDFYAYYYSDRRKVGPKSSLFRKDDKYFLRTGNMYMARKCDEDGWNYYDRANNSLYFYDMNFELLKEIPFDGYVSDCEYFNGYYYVQLTSRADGSKRNLISTDTENWTAFDGKIPSVTPQGYAVFFDEEKMSITWDGIHYIPVVYEEQTNYTSVVGKWIVSLNLEDDTIKFSNDGIYYKKFKLPPYFSGGIPQGHDLYEFQDDIVFDGSNCIYRYPKKALYSQLEEFKQYNNYVMINGSILGFNVPPVIDHDRMLVSMRFLFEQMGAEVIWDENTHSAVVKRDGNTINFTLGSKSALVNNEMKTMDVPAQLIQDKLMIPLRFLSENLGYSVQWDGEHNTVMIDTQ